MENTEEEFLLSTIKVEEEELTEHAPIDDQGSTVIEDSDEESFGAELHPTTSIPTLNIPTSPRNTIKRRVITKCKITWCTWTTHCQDKKTILGQLLYHACESHEQVSDICPACFQMFFSRNEFNQHNCPSSCLIQCFYCGYKYYDENVFLEHIRKKHNIYDLIQYNHQINILAMLGTSGTTDCEKKSRSEKINCPICDCKFFADIKLNYHMKIFHSITTDINMDSVYFTGPLVRQLVCSKCPSHYSDFTRLFSHYYQTHKRKLPKIKVVVRKSCVKYVCNSCLSSGSRTFDREMLEQHYLERHGKTFDVSEFDLSQWYTTMVTQLSNEEGNLKMSCEQCCEFYSTTDDLNKHRTQKHGGQLCHHCKLKFKTIKALELHIQEVHLGECKFCGFQTYNFTGLHTHVLAKHSDRFDVNDLTTIYKVIDTIGDAYHTCTLCQRSLSSEQNMKMHYFWFHKRYICDYCKLTFYVSTSESEHFVSSHLTDCIHCKCKFIDSKELESHLESNHLGTSYSVCEICGDGLKSREELVEHRTRHEYTNKLLNGHLCSQCGLQFKLRSSLEEHIKNKHAKNDQISEFCQICNKKYKSITLHMFKSHGAAPRSKMTKTERKCPICEKVFCNFFALKRHLKCHSKYKCTQCTMQFYVARNLEQHVFELHTNRYAYSCTECSKVFSTESGFNVHVKFHGSRSNKADLLPVLRCELCDQFSLNHEAMQTHIKSSHIKAGKLVNVKRKKPSGRPPYIKRVKT